MKIKKIHIRYTLIGLLVVLIVMQFFPIDKNNAETNATKDFLRIENADEEPSDLIRSACYDCHSNAIVYPWYSRIQPLGWWIKGHVKGGTKHLNFSTWGDYNPDKRAHKLEECIEELEQKKMPLRSYTWMHPKAKLSDLERKALADWFASL